jgi:hypothetical protein
MFVRHLGYTPAPRFGEAWTPDAVLSAVQIALKVGDATNSFYIPKDRVSEDYIIGLANKYAWTQSLLDQANIRYQLPPGVGAVDTATTYPAPSASLPPTSPIGVTALPEPGILPGTYSTMTNTSVFPLATSLPPTEPPSLSSIALLMGLAGLGFLILLPSGRRATTRYRIRRAARRGRK